MLLMDEFFVSVVLDLFGWFYFVFEGSFLCECVGDILIELVLYVFCLLCEILGVNLYFMVKGDNVYYMVEVCFKVVVCMLC